MEQPTDSPQDSPRSGLDMRRVLPVFALVFVDVLGLTIVLPLLHLYGAAFGGGALEIGLIAAAFPMAQLIGVPFMGALSDRFGRKPLLLISQITTCISFIMLGFANSLLLVILSRVLDGVFGANIATAQAALTDITDDENRAQGLGLIGAAFGLGFIFGPLIALISLEFTDNLGIPAFIAAAYSFISILLTLFVFDETLPPEKRALETPSLMSGMTNIVRAFAMPQVNVLLVLFFAQQVVFFGFEAMLGLFTLSRLGLLGQGNALVFLVVGVVLVTVQARFIGRWSRKYGERKLIYSALALMGVGLILVALTPATPQPFYVRQIVENELRQQNPDSTESIIGEIAVDLPSEEGRGIGGIVWLLIVIIPVSIGAGLIRPSLNSLITKSVPSGEYGRILGVSAALGSAANALAPISGGLMFQQFGTTIPFFVSGCVLAVLAVVSGLVIHKPAVNNDNGTA